MNDQKLFYNELKSQRESQNLTLEEISDFTKIDYKYLIAIEKGDFSCLPSVYMRLFLRSYCEYISADADKALNDYEFFTLGHKTETKSFVPRSEDLSDSIPIVNEKELNLPQVPTTKIITIAFTIVCLISAFFFLRYLGSEPNDSSSIDTPNDTSEDLLLDTDIIVEYSELPNDIARIFDLIKSEQSIKSENES